jgi:type IV secretory pathway TrbD component
LFFKKQPADLILNKYPQLITSTNNFYRHLFNRMFKFSTGFTLSAKKYNHSKNGVTSKSFLSRENLILNIMKSNKILLGGIAGGVTFFLLGWIIYGVLLMDYTTANYNQCAMRPMQDMIWWALILSNLAFGFLLSIVFSWSNTTGIMAGAKVGAIIGLLLSLSIDLSYYSMSSMFSNFTAVIVDIIVYTIMSAIVGVVVAWVMGMGKK